MSDYQLAWARAFVLTLVIEVPVLVWLTQRSGRTAWRRLVVAAFANAASHPLVWFVFPALAIPAVAALSLSELWAVTVEAVFLRAVWPSFSWRRAWIASGVANSLSFVAGVVLQKQLFGTS